jgi:hypothetical protein
VRGAFVLHITATAQTPADIITALAGGDIQQKTEALTCTTTVAVQEKLMTAEEEFSFEHAPEMVLGTQCVGDIAEVKLLAGKAVIKGELQTDILYRSAPGYGVLHSVQRVPFHEIIDVEGANETCRAFVTVAPTGCTVTAGSEEHTDTNTVSVTALLQVRVYRDAEYLAVSDAFSTASETQLQTEEIALETVLDDFVERVETTAGGVLPDEEAEIIDAQATVLPLELMEIDGAAVLRGRVLVHLLCKNALGELDCYDKACEYTLARSYTQTVSALRAQCLAAVTAVTPHRVGTQTTATVQLTVRGVVSALHNHAVLAQVQLLQPRQPAQDDIALRAYFAQAGEDLFDIAKRYAAAPSAIAAANNVSDGVLESDCCLLIPSAQ